MQPIRVMPTRVELDLVALPGRAWPWMLGLLLALLVLVAPIALFVHGGAQPERYAPLAYYASDEKDSTIYALAKARSPERANADVVVLGSSSARESLWTDEELHRHSGKRFWNLTSSGQNPLESLYLLEQQDLRPGQIVAVLISARMLSPADHGERLRGGAFLVDATEFLRREAAVGAIAAPGVPDTIERLLGARQYLGKLLHRALPNRLRHALYGSEPPPALAHYYEQHPPADPAFMEEARKRLSKGFATNGEANLPRIRQVLQQIAARCRRQGATLVVYEAPHRLSDRTDLFKDWQPRFHDMLEQAAEVPVRDLVMQLQLAPEDFYDITHLNAKGRERWSRAFTADVLAGKG